MSSSISGSVRMIKQNHSNSLINSTNSDQNQRKNYDDDIKYLKNSESENRRNYEDSIKYQSSTTKSDSGSAKSFSSRFQFLSWNPETYGIREFVNSYNLPKVVRITNCEDSNFVKTLLFPQDVDVTQPLLLYKKYRPVKVQGRSLKLQKNGKWKEIGPNLIIPDSFPGWFSLLTSDGKECALTLTSMGQIASARIPAFLTKFDIPVYKLTEPNHHESGGGKSVYVRSITKAGSVLRLLGVWADFGQNKGYSYPKSAPHLMGGSLGAFGGRLVARSLSHISQPQPQPYQYVQCLSHDNEVLFIPFTATGVFYPIAPRGGRNAQHVYPLSAIARMNRLPIRVKLICGCTPSNIPEFTGILQIDSFGTEDVILACTLLKERPTIFELEVDTHLELSQMNSEDLFIKSTSYTSALNFCHSEGEKWRRQIRVSLIKPKMLRGTLTPSSLFHKSLRLSRASPPPPSKLSLLFRPASLALPPSSPYNLGLGPSPPLSLSTSMERQIPLPNHNRSNNHQNNAKQNSISSSGGKDQDKEIIRRTRSFNMEVQSVSMSLDNTVDYPVDDLETSRRPSNKSNGHGGGSKLSTLLSFMSGGGKNVKNGGGSVKSSSVSNSTKNSVKERMRKLSSSNKEQIAPDVLSMSNHYSRHPNGQSNNMSMSMSTPPANHHSSNNHNHNHNRTSNSGGGNEVPYGTVLDDLTEEENIYAEITDPMTLKMNLSPMNRMSHYNYHHHSVSNMSSLLKGGGGSDGAFSGTLSGTFSSSNPSNRDEDIYDSVF